MIGFDRRALGGASSLVGIDEAGRGCLAGPVVAAAIHCRADFYNTSWCRRHSRQVDDSKKLSPGQRAAIVKRFAAACHENWIRIGVGSASVEEIEHLNIYHATTLAMRRALEVLGVGWNQGDTGDLWEKADKVERRERPVVMIDGRPIRNFPMPHEGVVKGDRQSLAIALAGIHAKEWRDARMRELDRQFPGYGFSLHKGYGTRAHLEALRRFGPCPHHRPSFLGKIRTPDADGPDASQCSLF